MSLLVYFTRKDRCEKLWTLNLSILCSLCIQCVVTLVGCRPCAVCAFCVLSLLNYLISYIICKCVHHLVIVVHVDSAALGQLVFLDCFWVCAVPVPFLLCTYCCYFVTILYTSHCGLGALSWLTRGRSGACSLSPDIWWQRWDRVVKNNTRPTIRSYDPSCLELDDYRPTSLYDSWRNTV